MFHMDQILT